MNGPRSVDDVPDESPYRRLPEPIRLAQTTTTQATYAVFVPSGIFPLGMMAAIGGADGGGCDGG